MPAFLQILAQRGIAGRDAGDLRRKIDAPNQDFHNKPTFLNRPASSGGGPQKKQLLIIYDAESRGKVF